MRVIITVTLPPAPAQRGDPQYNHFHRIDSTTCAMGVIFHADSESGLLSYDSMIASLRIAKNPDVRPKKIILVDSVFHTVFSPGACPRAGSLGLRGYCGDSAITRSQGYLLALIGARCNKCFKCFKHLLELTKHLKTVAVRCRNRYGARQTDTLSTANTRRAALDRLLLVASSSLASLGTSLGVMVNKGTPRVSADPA